MCELLICVYVCVNRSRWEVGGACMLSHGSSPKPEGQPHTGGTGTVCVTWCRSKDRQPGGG